MTKIVYNDCCGGFGLSEKGWKRYKDLGGTVKDEFDFRYDFRDDPILVQVVEELGKKACGKYANLCIRELSKGTKYVIDEYDGSERIVTMDEYPWKIA